MTETSSDMPLPPEKTPLPMREPRERAEGDEANNPLGIIILVGLLALLGFAGGFRYLVMALGLLLMIFLHEWGHFITARRTGMKVTQFFLGFGPRIWSFRKGEVEYGLRAIPAGAFVRIIGMNNLDPVEDPADEPRAFYNASYPKRLLVMTAGSMMHFIQALLLFVVLSVFIGKPFLEDGDDWQIAEIAMMETGETPSAVAGLEIGDEIISVDGNDRQSFGDFGSYIGSHPGEEVTLTVKRGGEMFETSTVLASLPQDDGSALGFLGVSPKSTPGSVLDGVALFGSTMRGTVFEGLPQLFSFSTFTNLGSQLVGGTGPVDMGSEDAERPVSVVGVVRVAGNPDFDWSVPIFFLAVVNVFVGVFNLLPLLPLDGGHVAIATYERLRSNWRRQYHADVAKLLPLAYAVMGILGFVFVSTLWLDVFNPIQ